MPDLLAPTNPVPNASPQPVRVTVPPPTDTSIQNVVDTNRVVRPDQRTGQETRDSTGAARFESNFMTFFQRLRGTRDLPETFMRVLQWQAQVSSGIRAGFAEELAELMEFLKMDENTLSEFLKNQLQSGSRFTGELFQLLRDTYRSATSDLLRSEILNFIKKYSDFSSTDHLEGRILHTTEEMAESLPSKWADQVRDLLAQLKNGVAAGDRQGNLALLKEKLFTLISGYVTQTHDHGRARGLLSMLALDVARYENGSEGGLLASMRRLAAAGVLPDDILEMSDEDLLRLLREGTFNTASRSNQFADRLASLTDQAVRGQGGVEAQEAFMNILRATLINESVYMPLNHMMLPMDWEGRKAFSEIWINPDADEGVAVTKDKRSSRMLIKMDIQDVGAFDLLFQTRGTEVSLQVSCPEAVAERSEPVAQDLFAILSRNGLNPSQVSVTEMRRPLTVSEAFPEIVRRMSGVNVRA